MPDVRDARVADHLWFTKAMRSKNSGEYTVQDVGPTDLERGSRSSLIFSGAVRENGSRTGEVIGVLGSLFDWVTESGKILQDMFAQRPSWQTHTRLYCVLCQP